MLKKLKSIFLYAGVDQISFNRIKPKIQKANLTMTIVLSLLATILITSMYISSYSSDGIKQNRNVYIFGALASLIILVLALLVAKKHPKIVIILVYLSYSVYYLYGILIGTITDPTGKTVTFMVLLVFLPILFIDRPIQIIITTFVFVTFFIKLCYIYKDGPVLSVDLMDSIVFSILGLVSSCIINRMKIRGYTLEQKLKEISRIDQLTQVRNRNAYEFERDSIPNICKNSLSVIYIDVNGLHEMNNENGHEFGDEMLKYVASEIKYTFSDEFTYRIGGDEFVAFVPDKTNSEIEGLIKDLLTNIKTKNYHIAVGFERAKTKHLYLDNLINTAEKKMIENKKRYYKNIANRELRNGIN